MPYPITKKDDKFCVNGKCYSDRPKALAYQRALYANVPDAKKEQLDTLLQSDKCWDDWNDDDWYGSPTASASKLDPKDPRVLYDPLGGTKTKACANCHWFNPGQDTCQIVSGPILPTGLSGMWLELKEFEPDPIRVQVVSGLPGMTKESTPTGQTSSPLTTTFLNQVKTLINQALGKKEIDGSNVTSGFKMLPNNKWVAFYTNNAQDKEEEIFSEKAHDQYISWVDNGQLPLPELWHWHLPVKHGVAEWVGRVGHVMMAVGKFDATPEAAAFKEYYEKNEQRLSHGYYYPRFAKKEGVYELYATFEISTLPVGRESNPYTSFEEVKEMSSTISSDKATSLTKILGAELAAKYLGDAEKLSKGLDEMGVKFKEATEGVLQDVDARSAVKEVAEIQMSMKQALETLTSQVTTATKELKDAVAAIVEAEKARDQKVTDIYEAVKTAFTLQPSARMAASTVIPADNPLLVELKKKQAEQGASGNSSIFDLFGLNAMSKGTPEVK